MVTTFPVAKMLPLNLWNKQALQASAGAETGTGNGSLLAQMPFGHPLVTSPGFIPVSFNSSLYRPGDHVTHGLYSYPALHPSFFRPHLDPAAIGNLLNPRAMMSLHHVDARAADQPHPSAFTPAKRLRAQFDDNQSSPRDDGSPRDDLGSRDPDRDTSGSSNRTSPLTPVARSTYSPATSLSHHKANGELSEPHYVNGAEDLRLKWKCEDGEGLRCPICKALLQPGEVRTHLYKEFTSLKEELQSYSLKKNNHLSRPTCDINDSSSKSRYDTFLRIRRNREARLGKLRGDRNKRKRFSDEMSHSSTTEQEDITRLDHLTNRNMSPHRDMTEEETVDVTSCEDPDVGVMFSHPSSTATTTVTNTTMSSPTSTEGHSTENKDPIDRGCVSRQSPYTDPPRLT